MEIRKLYNRIFEPIFLNIFVTSRTDYQIQLPSMRDIVTAGPYNGIINTIVILALFYQ